MKKMKIYLDDFGARHVMSAQTVVRVHARNLVLLEE